MSCSSRLFLTMKIVRHATDLHNLSLRYGILSLNLDEPVSVHKLDYWMSLFLLWKRDGRMVDAIRQIVYSTSSLHGVQRYLRNLPQFADVAFFSKSSPFSRLRKALDVIVV